MGVSVPASLRKIKVFLTRADELDRDKGNPESRVVAFNCRQYAVLSGIPLAQDAEAKACLGDLLNLLEKEKEAMAVFSKAEHWKICRKVADRVFDKADSEDRAGAATKVTAKSFYAAGTFYEILQQFHEDADDKDVIGGEAMEEEEQRRVYCKWKANDILKAIKEGRTPTPGGYQQEKMDEMPLPSTDAPLKSHDDLPPAPTVPSSSMFDSSPVDDTDPGASSMTQHDEPHHMPSFYKDSIEVNLNGNPTPVQETVEEEDDAVEEIFIPGAVKAAADSVSDALVDQPRPTDPPPPYPSDSSPVAIPPPAATHTPLSTQIGSSGGGMFSSLFGNKKKLSKIQLSDATELTRFALAALEKGDGELGRQRLEQALALWK